MEAKEYLAGLSRCHLARFIRPSYCSLESIYRSFEASSLAYFSLSIIFVDSTWSPILFTQVLTTRDEDLKIVFYAYTRVEHTIKTVQLQAVGST
jgi:hypothetical protein